jgi:hypothetical protein
VAHNVVVVYGPSAETNIIEDIHGSRSLRITLTDEGPATLA